VARCGRESIYLLSTGLYLSKTVPTNPWNPGTDPSYPKIHIERISNRKHMLQGLGVCARGIYVDVSKSTRPKS